MKLPWPFSRKSPTASLDQIIQRLEAIHETLSGITVTPETCMQSPTVHAIVTAISRRISVSPVHVFQKKRSGKHDSKELLPSHPVERLLNRPNDWQASTSFWLDSTSALVRYGNAYHYKARGNTGPIRRLMPLIGCNVSVCQDVDWNVTYRVTQKSGYQEYQPWEIMHSRGPARDNLTGDSPVWDLREAIALEIAAEKFGASFFGNGAMPFMMFKLREGFKAGPEGGKRFLEQFHQAFGNRNRFKAMLTPDGYEVDKPIPVENDKAQFIETRKYQRTVIAGGFGIGPQYVGDLERGTMNNVEQQSIGFVQDVVLPYARIFEAAMERDLLTDQDRRDGIIIRFNLDGSLRGDFKTRQEGLKIQREAGVISPNEWREHEGMNPISAADGGDTYWQEGPSGQNQGGGTGGAAEPAPGDDGNDD